MTDYQFIEKVKAGSSEMQRCAEWFYNEHFKLVYHAIKNKHLLREEALDAYSDAITYFIDNIRTNRFNGKSKCSTYFIRIFNNKCIDVIRNKTTNTIKVDNLSLDSASKELIYEEKEEIENIDIPKIMANLSKICQDVLMDWNDGYSMKEIAERNGLKNANTARSKRYNCFTQLMSIVGQYLQTPEKIND